MSGQLDIFSALTNSDESSALSTNTDNFTDKAEFSFGELLRMEKESLGFYVSGHPLDMYKEVLEANSDFSTLDIAEAGDADAEEKKPIYDGMNLSICGMISARKNKITKSGKMMCFLQLEDLVGRVEVIMFPDKLARFDSHLEVNKIVRVTGRLDFKEDEDPKIICENIMLYKVK